MMWTFIIVCLGSFLLVDSAPVTRRRVGKQRLEFGRILENERANELNEYTLGRSLSDASLAMSMPNDMSMPTTAGPTSLSPLETSQPNTSPTLSPTTAGPTNLSPLATSQPNPSPTLSPTTVGPTNLSPLASSQPNPSPTLLPTSFQSPVVPPTSAPTVSIPLDGTSSPTLSGTTAGSEVPSGIAAPDSTTATPTQIGETMIPTASVILDNDVTSNPTSSDSLANDGTLSPTSSGLSNPPSQVIQATCTEDTGDLEEFEVAFLSVALEVETRNNSTDFFDELADAILNGIRGPFALCSPVGQNRVLVFQRRTNENLVKGLKAIEGPQLSETDVCTPEVSENTCYVVEEVIAVYAETDADAQSASEEVFQVISILVDNDALFNDDTPAGDIVDVRLYEPTTNSDSSINTDQKPNAPTPQSSARTNLVVGICVGIGGAASLIVAAFLVRRKKTKKEDEDKSYGSEESYTIQNSTCPSPLSSAESSQPPSPLQPSSEDSESPSESTVQLASSDDMASSGVSSGDMASSGDSESPSESY